VAVLTAFARWGVLLDEAAAEVAEILPQASQGWKGKEVRGQGSGFELTGLAT
jgi:hypothetical protein